ncbi:MAG: AIR carboxylase family protein, partial [Gemmatimonadaceae bacterium]|nr:AIR carboxylase family protein [Gemmatimonadaceae bacterium]
MALLHPHAMSPSAPAPLVGVIMGSTSDYQTVGAACTVLEELAIPFEARVVSAHRTPEWMMEYARTA